MEHVQSRLTLGRPIKFQDFIIELCDAYGMASDDLQAYFSTLQPQDLVIANLRVPPSNYSMGAISLKAQLEDNSGNGPGYHIYPFPGDNEQVYFDVCSGYPENLTDDETRELAELISKKEFDSAESEKFNRLSFNFRYPIRPAERAARNDAANNPKAVGQYLTLDKPISFEDAFQQLCRLYSYLDEFSLYNLKAQLQYFSGHEVIMALLVPGNEELPNILQMTTVPNPGEIPYSVTIYPCAYNPEDSGREYDLVIQDGVPGILTREEESECAQLVLTFHRDLTANDRVRREELLLVKQGNLTLAEVRAFRACQKGN